MEYAALLALTVLGLTAGLFVDSSDDDDDTDSSTDTGGTDSGGTDTGGTDTNSDGLVTSDGVTLSLIHI